MQRYAKMLLIVSLSILAGTVSLTLVTASLVIVNYLHDHQPIIVLPMGW